MIRLLLYVPYYLLNVLVDSDAIIIFSTMPLALLCFFNIYRITKPNFTVLDIFWFLMYIFFVIGPLQGYDDGYFSHGGPVDGYPLAESEIVTASAIAFIFAAVVTLMSIFPRKTSNNLTHFHLSIYHAPVLTMMMVIFFIGYVVTSGGFSNIFASRYQKAYEDSSFISVVFYGAQIVTATLCATIMRHNRFSTNQLPIYILQFGIILTILCVIANPINSPRYFLVAAWMPIGFVFLGGSIGASRVYAFLAFSLLILMPILSISTRQGEFSLSSLDIQSMSESIFKIPFIDVFDMLAYEVNYIGRSGFYWGGKTIGVLLFFIPRSLWTGKETLVALDIGQELVGMNLAGTDNLSLFFGGEFYADGGLIGVIIGSIILGLWLHRVAIPRAIWINGINISALILMAAMPILLRGPIGANLPLTISEYFILHFTTLLIARRKRFVPRDTRILEH